MAFVCSPDKISIELLQAGEALPPAEPWLSMGNTGGGDARYSSIESLCSAIAHSKTGDNHLALFSAHQMGTCRMGRNASSAVCNERGEVFGVSGLFIGDASAFPGSSGVNPMITIMALAHHTASGIAGEPNGR